MNFKVYTSTDYNNDYLFDLPPSSSVIVTAEPKAILTSIPGGPVTAGVTISLTGTNLLNTTSITIISNTDPSIILPGQYSIESDTLIKFIIPPDANDDNYYIQISSSGGIYTFNRTILINSAVKDKTYLHQEVFLYTGTEETFEIANITQNTLTVTMIAGGGCSGESYSVGGIQFSGGGGGGGGAIVNVPITVLFDETITLYVGGGGKTLGTNGDDSYIIVGSNFFAVSGGKAGIFNTGGARGIGLQDGADGSDGSAQLPSGPVPTGGIGGQSFIGYGGGKKQPRAFPDVVGYGGGGKGMDVGSTTIGAGQNGIIILTYASS